MQPASVTTTSIAAAYSVPSVIFRDGDDLLRAGEPDARVDLDALDRQRKLEDRHVGHRIRFREEADRAHVRSGRERSGHR